MVNYCCVYGCGRNSKLNENLSFYSLPKEKHRQVAWLKAAGREDLIEKKFPRRSKSRRFCSRHFSPSNIKNKSRHLGPDVVPTLFLPGSWDGERSDDEHMDIACNGCKKPIVGFRYKCVTCEDFDLCQKCEYMEAHREHFVLRIPKPLKFKLADDLIKKWRKFFNAEHIVPDALDSKETALTEDSSDDDQPITKYAKNYDSGVDLSEDVKEKIRKEIQRVANLKLDSKKVKKSPKVVQKKKEDRKRPATKDTVESYATDNETGMAPSKRLKQEEEYKANLGTNNTLEVAFADVNDIKDLKPERVEYPNLMPVISSVSSAGPSTTVSLSQPSTSGIAQTTTQQIQGPGPIIQVPGPTYPAVTSMSGVTTMTGVPTFMAMPGNLAMTSMPEAVTSMPGAVTSMLGAVTSMPGAVTSMPGAVTSMPGAVTSIPGAVTSMPDNPAVTAMSANMQQPVMHVKLSDDLSELMIEVTSNNQRTVYKYPDSSQNQVIFK